MSNKAKASYFVPRPVRLPATPTRGWSRYRIISTWTLSCLHSTCMLAAAIWDSEGIFVKDSALPRVGIWSAAVSEGISALSLVCILVIVISFLFSLGAQVVAY